MKSMFQKLIIFIFSIISVSIVEAKMDQPFTLDFMQTRALLAPRDYHFHMTPVNKKDLKYMLDILANYSMVSIGFKKNSIEAAGNRIAHIHPLRTFIEMLNDVENNINIHKIRARSVIWETISARYAEALDEEDSFGNVYPHTKDFSREINILPTAIQSTVQKRNWIEFFDLLLAI